MNKDRIKKLAKIFSNLEDKTSGSFKAFDAGVADLKENLRQQLFIETVDEVNDTLSKVKRDFNLEPIISAFEDLKSALEKGQKEIVGDIKDVVSEVANELDNKLENKQQSSDTEIKVLREDIQNLQSGVDKALSRKEPVIPDFSKQIKDTEKKLKDVIDALAKEVGEDDSVEKFQKIIEEKINDLDKAMRQIRTAIQTGRGGSMNRKVTFGGTDYLTKFTDINYKAGTNVTFTIANNEQTKMVDVTITSTGGGGSVRSINSISASQTADSVAGTDYVYLCTGTIILTLPTAVANTNLYTVKNVGSGIITVDTTSSQTIDGALTQVMPVQFTSIDIISDTANYNIT